MNSVKRTRAQMQMAILIESFRQSSGIPSLVGLAHDYSIKSEPELIISSIKTWEDRGYLIVARDLSGFVGACLKRDAISDALEEVLDTLEANTFKVDWEKEEILTDATNLDLVPAREGWKLFHLEPDDSSLEGKTDASSAAVPFQIVNNFTPQNTVTVSSTPSNDTPDRSGWWNFAAAITIGIITILVTLWVAGKI